MRRKFSLSMFLGVALALFMLSGCDTLDYWKEDITGHYYKLRSQLHGVHQFVDRHFFDYNEDDPTLPY
jgi:predicted aminopeptidase